ncbi:GNAT family N-acetyltransferase [Amycolatopsis acidicola]|uniref:GNAT family N-acetyltransferase n=1 Tax=Amycolatopsis acidicola TaxID=2596893 RepID=A0A5N0USY0_9PSEU|nr:GNAT family protein [Amycolatopsis acidicola]KAA9154820.1 GNAT family N-acetyltransferase [Amycolatopsis acidicola]
MRPAEYLTDGVVTLRRWRAGDAAALERAVTGSLDHIGAFLPWAVAGYGEADAVDFLTRTDRQWRVGDAFEYAILGAGGELAGGCGLMTRIGGGGLEIGYWLSKSATGQGLVTRASRLLTEEAFRIGATRVEIHHDEANVRSGAVPERLGFTRVGTRTAGQAGGPASTGTLVVWRLKPGRG